MKVAALSIEGTRVAITLGVRTLGRAKVLDALEPMALPQADEDKTQAFAEILIQLKEEHGVKGVVVGLEPALFTHTFVTMPVSGRNDIAQALGFELEKYLPLPPDEYYYDFHSIRNVSEGSRNLVLSARKDKLRWIGEGVKIAGVALLGIRSTALEVTAGLIAAARSGTGIFVYQGAISAAAIEIADSVPMSLSFRTLGDDPKAAIKDMLKDNDRDVYISGAEGIPSYTGDNVRSFRLSTSGALIKGLTRRKLLWLDFAPSGLRPDAHNYMPIALSGLAGLCVTIFFLTTILAYAKDRAALSSVRSRLNEIRTTASEVVDIKRESEEIEKKIMRIKEFERERNRHIHTLKRLSQVLPVDAWLTGFTANDEGVVEIEGYAKRTADIIRPLEKSDEFSDITFSTPVTVREGQEKFAIKMRVDR